MNNSTDGKVAFVAARRFVERMSKTMHFLTAVMNKETGYRTRLLSQLGLMKVHLSMERNERAYSS